MASKVTTTKKKKENAFLSAKVKPKTKKELEASLKKLNVDMKLYTFLSVGLGVLSVSFFSVSLGTALAEKKFASMNAGLLLSSVLLFAFFGHCSGRAKSKEMEMLHIEHDLKLRKKRKVRGLSNKV